MRTLAIGLLAAAGLALAIPAHADDVSVGTSVRGPSVGIGVREHAREHVTVGVGERERHCKVVIVKREGMTKKIKRCD